MAEKYPLVEQREYTRAGKRGGFLSRRVSRTDDELPTVAPHHVRVFRIGEAYVEDHGQLRSDDRTVVDASSVTVVDRRVEVPVVVETSIPSGEVGEFTVRTTFYCTVVDACAVVRDGITDVEALLLSHLRSVPGFVEDGSDRAIVDSLAVRDRIDARLTAYQEMRPTVLSGLRARHGAVEVLTPAELADALAKEEEGRRKLEWTREREEREQEANLRRALLETELEIRREKLRNITAVSKERNRQEEERLRNRYQRDEDTVQQEHDLLRQAERNRATRAELVEDYRLIGVDPSAADFLALRSGDITSDELAQRLDSRRRADHEADLQRLSVDREDERWKLERDDRLHELTRADRREDAVEQRREELRRWEADREDELRRREEARADEERRRRDEREWAREVLNVKATLSKEAIARGLFDGVPSGPGDFINEVGEVTVKPQSGGRALPEEDAAGELEGAARTSGAGDRPRRDTGLDDDGELDLGGTDSEASLGH
ncbi:MULTISPECIES: hypothetical protein [unclassified Streptomyces]|uniref:hypothetical protein n=1 Tax=unclassified Streptomyces TaxID=2593676 RepID=UPI0024B75FAE|nr:hypothetical protein [Streptomyces sp. KAU_LT]MDI9832224.1 hypothetical protein [Streptomyces sp. KAU_LT]